MGKAAGSPGFFQRLLARPAPAVEDDAADFGTCFGLELSLAPVQDPPAPVPERGEPGAGWIRRLSRRDPKAG